MQLQSGLQSAMPLESWNAAALQFSIAVGIAV
jgi:hypothetical protein